ncbi:MAG: sensor histidine kinase, partial [Saprospiraceae bacterium]
AEKIGIVIIQASIFYWLFYSFLPKNKWRDIPSILEVIFGIVISVLAYRVWVGYIVYPWIYGDEYPGNPFGFSLLLISFINIYSFVGIAGAIKLIRNRQQQKEVEQQLVKEKLESELHFLRAQINPHFFFNTLNNIYGLARKNSEHTAEVVMRLSKLMRFILYECTSEKIPIFQEIKVLEDYIELEKIRYDNRLVVNFTKKIDDLNQSIAPLLLLPFVENSFKHGASEMRFKTQIDIEIYLENNQLEFSIFNKRDADINKNEKGLGLQNVKRQLELLYPNLHQLNIEQTESSFQVNLKIDLK